MKSVRMWVFILHRSHLLKNYDYFRSSLLQLLTVPSMHYRTEMNSLILDSNQHLTTPIFYPCLFENGQFDTESSLQNI